MKLTGEGTGKKRIQAKSKRERKEDRAEIREDYRGGKGKKGQRGKKADDAAFVASRADLSCRGATAGWGEKHGGGEVEKAAAVHKTKARGDGGGES